MDEFPIEMRREILSRIPSEVRTEILSRVPIRYILRCRSVSKAWKNMIDAHSLPPTLLFYSSNFDAFYLLEDTQTTKIDFSAPNPGNDLLFHTDPCNGFLGFTFMISDKSNENGVISTYVYNPITQQCLMLPDLPNPFRKYSLPRTIGFGLDPATNTFKVIHLLKQGYSIHARVFTLGSHSWRNLHNVPQVPCFRWPALFVNGSFHWLTRDGRILSFDLTSELFSFIEIPQLHPLNITASGLGLQLVDLGGCLCVFDPFSGGDIEVWVMKNYNVNPSWSKIVIMKSCLEGVPSGSGIPFTLWRNGTILLMYSRSGIFSYEFESGKCTELQINGIATKGEDGLWNREYGFFPCVGNLMRIMPPRQLAE